LISLIKAKVTHETPCIDPCVQRRTRSKSYRLISLAGQSPHGDDKEGEGDQYEIWPLRSSEMGIACIEQ